MKKDQAKAELDHHLATMKALSLPDVTTATAFARFVDLPISDITASIEAGGLPARKIGTEWVLSRRALLAWLASRPK